VLQTIAMLLVAFWLLGMVMLYTMGGLIHILLIVAIVAFAVSIIEGRRRPLRT